jgi:iron complex transport system ATP-binding protein
MILQAQALQYTVNNTRVLHGLDFGLRAGEFVGLIGPNGAGKSTLLKLLGGQWQPSGGSVLLEGRALASYSAREMARRIAHVPQSTALAFPFTAREVVLMGRSPHLRRFQIESSNDRAIAERALHATNAAYLADRIVTTLSGGESQRVVLARALAQEPKILLLDEPTSNLDVKHQMEILSLARTQAHQHGLGVIAAVHDLSLAARYCDRLALLVCGEIIADGPPDAVLTSEQLRYAFGVNAQLYRDPYTGSPALSLRLGD